MTHTGRIRAMTRWERGTGDVSWARWPRWLSCRAYEITAEVRAGHPSAALDGLDALIADLEARRQTVIDIANRHFEPSTDDRNL